MVKKISKKTNKAKKQTAKKVKKQEKDSGKYIITALVIVLIGIILFAIANIDSLFPKQPTNDNGVVVATVNGIPIYEKEIDKRLSYLQAQFPTATKEFALNHTINQLLLLEEAKKNGINVDEDEIIKGVDKWLKDVVSQVPKEQLDAMLTKQNITFEEFRNDTIKNYHDELMIFGLFNKTIFAGMDISNYVDTEITDEDLRNFYDENIDAFNRINVSHILVCYNGSLRCNNNRTKEEALKIINKVKDKLHNNGNFEELAKEYSDGPSGVNGGNLGYFAKGQMTKKFEDAAFALKYPNQISDIVETEYGYHIIKLNGKKSDFEDYKTEIGMQIQVARQKEAEAKMKKEQEILLTEYIKKLRDDADIRYYSANPTLSRGIVQNPLIQTFNKKEGDICTEEGKPVIRLYSTTTCPHCRWIRDTYDSVVKEYVNSGKIIAHHWELDTGDDTLTSTVETFVPEDEKTVFSEFNSRNSIPTFVFGCQYYRIGNGYEADKDLLAEEREFRAIIDKLIAENNAKNK